MDRTKTLTALAALLLTSCSQKPELTVGSKNFSEQLILGELVAQHLENTLHIHVRRKLDLGGTLLAQKALEAGEIDLYPEYTGTALTTILKQPPDRDPAEVLKRVREGYRHWNLEWTDPIGFNNTFAMVIRKEDADERNVHTISEAATFQKGWKLGVGYEFVTRPDGLPGLIGTYRLNTKGSVKSMDLGLLYQALEQGQVDMVAGNSTDGQLAAKPFIVLDDDQHYFPPYEAAWVVRGATLTRLPALRNALAQLHISTDQMRQMNGELDAKHTPVNRLRGLFYRVKCKRMFNRLLLTALCTTFLAAQTTNSPPPATASVSGRTLAAGGQPLKKTKLTLWSTAPPPPGQPFATSFTTVSDTEGKFSFDAVDAGRYSFYADHPGFQRKQYGARPSNSNGTIIALEAGKVVSAVDFVLDPQVLISGKVLDTDGDPVPQVQVSALKRIYLNGRQRFGSVAYAATDENGDYKLQNLGPGKFYLVASPPGNHYYDPHTRAAVPLARPGQPPKPEEAAVLTYYPGVTDFSTAQPIELIQGHDRVGTNFTFHKVAVFHVRGKVSGELPADRSQLHVTVMPRASYNLDSCLPSSRLGKDGLFDVQLVPAGSYFLVLSSSVNAYKALAMLPVDVGTRDLDNLLLTAEASLDLTGAVTMEKNPDAPPVASEKDAPVIKPFRVNLQPIEGPMVGNLLATAAEDGSFTIANVPPGLYRPNVFSVSKTANFYVKTVRYADQEVLANGMKLSPGDASTRLEITIASDGARLDGVLQDSEGKPLNEGTITLIPNLSSPFQLDLYKTAAPDKDGKFTINSIHPGKYRIYAWDRLEPGNQWDPEFMRNYETKGTALDLEKLGSKQVTLVPIKTTN